MTHAPKGILGDGTEVCDVGGDLGGQLYYNEDKAQVLVNALEYISSNANPSGPCRWAAHKADDALAQFYKEGT